ncbi:hypothetical protein M9458_043903, partial [Cirrhinus mrigala]
GRWGAVGDGATRRAPVACLKMRRTPSWYIMKSKESSRIRRNENGEKSKCFY